MPRAAQPFPYCRHDGQVDVHDLKVDPNFRLKGDPDSKDSIVAHALGIYMRAFKGEYVRNSRTRPPLLGRSGHGRPNQVAGQAIVYLVS